MSDFTVTRRNFIKTASASAFAGTLGFSITGLTAKSADKKLGIALVGLGNYSTRVLAPALQQTEHIKLTGIVTGTPAKIPEWQEQYGIKDKNIYNYETMHEAADNPDIDVFYIVLPNNMHKPYSIIAAEAGKHVFCEKPMALDEAECHDIIAACEKNNVRLSIGYRMQHEPITQQIIAFGREKTYGDILHVRAADGFFLGNTNHWKAHSELGGGAMMDMGVYAVNASRYVTGEEPIAVTAKIDHARPDEFTADEIMFFDLEFPSGIVSNCMTSLAHRVNELHVTARNGWYEMKPFMSYGGIRGETSDRKVLEESVPNQQAHQMEMDALSILNEKPMQVPGEEGMLDMRVVDAAFKSAKTGKRVEIKKNKV